ncbi:E3 ubiquitin-protein ligase RNFT2-like [Rhopilema esculentum]|uniref:E3 ubiquitin-protein ligase RNFT2-like n=1 Tax=Rhopilema esculentum TaxID=499914 RepID=UPI0031D66543|eukprot:gene15672-6962_t
MDSIGTGPTLPFSQPSSYHPRTHSRSASWSHTSGATTSIPLLSPIRVIQELVPSFTNSGRQNEIESGLTSRNGPRYRSENTGQLSRQASAIDIEAGESQPNPQGRSSGNGNRATGDRVEFYGAITWAENILPFILLLCSRIMWDHRLGILVFIGMFGAFFHANNTIRRQVALKERRMHRISLWTFTFLTGNIIFVYYVFHRQRLEMCLLFQKPNFLRMDVWTVFWCVGITDFVIMFATMALKSILILLPRSIVPFRKRGKIFLVVEQLSQLYRTLTPFPQWLFFFTDYNLGGEYFATVSSILYLLLKGQMGLKKVKEVVAAIRTCRKEARYGQMPSQSQILEAGNSCPICQEELANPVALRICKHIFCEDCIAVWFDRERTCPMCRANVAEDPTWKDGSTSLSMPLF